MNIPPVVYEKILRPILFQLDPETAHHVAMFWLRFLAKNKPLLNLLTVPPDPSLRKTVFGLNFPSAVGLAAGFDKNALALPAWPAMGFGFIEAGTITAQAQPGNPKPRIFRIPESGALINRMGFNNDGADAVAVRLGKLKATGNWPAVPVGLNIGKTKVTPIEEATADYLYSFEKLFPYADYFVLNVSSPNTPGLRTLQNKAALDELFKAVQRKNKELSGRAPAVLKPVLVKIAPDLEFSQIDEILELVWVYEIQGVIATNTTLDHSGIPKSKWQQGGLSGMPLRQKSTEIVRYIATKSSAPVIASGGIFDADSAKEKMDAGASLVQLYTGFVYKGPALVREVRAAIGER
ncbi:MAG: quinone-dependent dihydroorotate dehydrogenase [Verrucomicrobiota bacterium]